MATSHPNFRSDAGQAALDHWYASMLSRIQVPYRSLTVATRFGETHLLATGPDDAPPVILLHGMEGSAISWRHQLNALSNDYRLYALDIIGSTGKSCPVRLPFVGHSYSEWLVDVLAGLGLRAASFVGMSTGCWLTVRLAEYAPQAITRAVMISPYGLSLTPMRFPFGLLRLLETRPVDALMGVVAATLITRERIRWLVTRTTPAGLPTDPDEAEWFYVLAKYYHYRYPPPPASDEQLRALTAPTLLLMGEKEQFLPLYATIIRARAHLTGLRAVKVLAGVGHNLATDNPPRINRYIRAFLSPATSAPHAGGPDAPGASPSLSEAS